MSAVSRLMAQYKKTGKVGRVTAKDDEHARQIAEAIAESKQQEAKRRR